MNSSNKDMSERETKVRGQKRKTFDRVRASVVLGILGLILGAVVMPPWPVWGIFGMVGLALGIIALYQTAENHEVPSSYIGPVVGAGLNSVLVVLAVSAFVSDLPSQAVVQRVVCGSNLSRLGKAIQNYGGANRGKYPAAHKWCNLLLEGNYVTDKVLRCKGALAQGYEAKCHYAMNPNCEPNSPGDVVLLFESKGGWNQFGGPELLAPEHHGGEGCNILFSDGHVDFVRIKRLGELKWK